MNVKEFYEQIGGNYQKALSIMMNDVLIMRMLTKFFSNNQSEETINAYERGDIHGVFVASHSLKGVAGNLCLTPLLEIASAITEATRNEEKVNIDKEINELKERYKFIFEKYQQISQ